MDVVQKRNIRKQIEKETERYLKAGKKIQVLPPSIRPHIPEWNCRNGWDWDAMAGMGIYSGIDGEMSEMIFGAGEKHPWKGRD